MQAHSHTPGALKQSNKKHKGSTSSKRAQKRSLGAGKVSSAAIAAVRTATAGGGSVGGGAERNAGRKGPKSKDHAQDSRLNRVNRNQQLRKQKRADTMLQKRLGSNDGPPKIVGIVSLSRRSATNADAVLEGLLSDSSWHQSSAGNVTHALFSKHKARFTFIKANGEGDLLSALDIAKVADIIVLVVGVDPTVLEEGSVIDEEGYTMLSAMKAVGCPELVCCVQGFETLTGKRAIEAKHTTHRELETAIGPDIKIIDAKSPDLLSRQLSNTTPRVIAWKASRSFMLGDSVQLEASAILDDGGVQTFSAQIGGFLRGKPLPVNSLVHIVGVGTCRVDRVVSASEPFPGGGGSRRRAKGSMNVDKEAEGETAPQQATAVRSKQDPLFMEAARDDLAGEQTWPTEAEMDEAMRNLDEGAGRNRRNIPAVIPEGMSSYQADWFMDEQGVWDGEGEAPMNEVAVGGAAAAAAAVAATQGGDEDAEPFVDEGAADDEDETFTMNGSMLDAPFAAGKGQAEKQRLRALADSDVQFPDEMDTPDDRAARERFAKYRALQSFRSSPWHPKENLPRDYSRIFQFENFSGVQRRILAGAKAAEGMLEATPKDASGREPFCGSLKKENPEGMLADDQEEEGGEEADEFVFAGQYVHLVVDGLSAASAERLSTMGHAMLFALHRHENRLSVLHFNLRRLPGYEEPIKSKETLIFSAGFRSFACNPIFSESNLNCDKHKLERFLLVGIITHSCSLPSFQHLTHTLSPPVSPVLPTAGSLQCGNHLRPHHLSTLPTPRLQEDG